MTLIDKDKLLEAFRHFDNTSDGEWRLLDCEITINEQPEIPADFKSGYRQGVADQKDVTARIEYDISAKCNALEAENAMLRDKLESIETEFARMRAQLDMVYLIFGGK